ncbi:hypothetical protein RhiirA5_436113 [Rhizophagus irregularis]|uniref:Uncharacterized protein n=1 Tax=Rhizophagus irregularis TaxID=588596 RepID=A0A2N0NMH4_9GLOM|nr:hypothetical protein RhiirA5_436113 [Rhizophagus irregularis]
MSLGVNPSLSNWMLNDIQMYSPLLVSSDIKQQWRIARSTTIISSNLVLDQPITDPIFDTVRSNDLITIIQTHIKEFMKNISQMSPLLKFKYNLPEKTHKELCEDFDVCIVKIDASNLTTTTKIKDKIHPKKEE